MEDPIPWHLGVHSNSMYKYAPISSLIFEHTRLTIRVVAFMYQKYRDWDMPMGIPEDFSEETLKDLKDEVLDQVDEWKPSMANIAIRLKGFTSEGSREVVDLFAESLRRHVELVYTLAQSTFEKKEEIAERVVNELDGRNASSILNSLVTITGGDISKFKSLWTDHLRCTVAYIEAGRTGEDLTFDQYASACMRDSVNVGIALDQLMRPTPTRISSKENVYW